MAYVPTSTRHLPSSLNKQTEEMAFRIGRMNELSMRHSTSLSLRQYRLRCVNGFSRYRDLICHVEIRSLDEIEMATHR